MEKGLDGNVVNLEGSGIPASLLAIQLNGSTVASTTVNADSRWSMVVPRLTSQANTGLAYSRLTPLAMCWRNRLAIKVNVVPTPTNTPTETPTNTPEPTSTETVTPIATATDVTPEPTSTSTDTPEPTSTSTETPVPTDTAIPTDTAVPTETPTETAEPTSTATDTPEPTDTPTETPVAAGHRRPSLLRRAWMEIP